MQTPTVYQVATWLALIAVMSPAHCPDPGRARRQDPGGRLLATQ